MPEAPGGRNLETILLSKNHPVLTSERRPDLIRLLDMIRERRTTFSTNKKIDSDVVELMKQVGVYRAMVAKRFGGEEWTPCQFLQLIEEISRADGSAGWIASFGISALYMAALPLTTLNEIYANGPDVVFAGGSFPSRTVERIPDGLKVAGRWTFASGCTGADLIGAAVIVENNKREKVSLIAAMPKSQVKIIETWEVSGLRGTGSFDIVVDDVIVPEDWAFVRGGKPSINEPLYSYPVMAISSHALSVVALGVARAALDELKAIAADRTSITGMPALTNRPYVQSELAKAEAALLSARSFFYDVTEETFEKLCAGELITQEMITRHRLAATNAARTGAQVAQTVYTISGTTGIYTDNRIGQALQDALIVPQHAFLSEATWQSLGAALLGMEPPEGSL